LAQKGGYGVEDTSLAAGAYSSGYRHSRAEILAAFRAAHHTARSRAILLAIDTKTMAVVCSARLKGAGRAAYTHITVNRTMNMDDILATLVHEGQHYLDMASELIPPPHLASMEQRLLAEARAHYRAAEFARLNDLVSAQAYRHAQVWPEVLLESIVQSPSYPFVNNIPDALFARVLQGMVT
jgi:hypothetical protein